MLVVLLCGLTVSLVAVLFIEDKSREFWPTVGMKAIFLALGIGIMALAITTSQPGTERSEVDQTILPQTEKGS